MELVLLCVAPDGLHARARFLFLVVGQQSRLWGLACHYRIGRPKGSGKSLD